MTEFSELLAGLRHGGNAWTVSVSDDWLQGRTLYGGLSTALCMEAVRREFADLPPLRSAQIAFVGPSSGELKLRSNVLRRGKSTAFIGTDLTGEAGLATRATFCFGAARASTVTYRATPGPSVKKPDDCPNFFEGAPASLRFLEHIDGRHVGGHRPFSGATEPDMTLWLRHREANLESSLVSLLALADAPPPAAATMMAKPGPISTMTWSIDMLTDEITTDDGWWLIRTTAETAQDGYSSQTMTVWNASGRPIMISRQNVAVFV